MTVSVPLGRPQDLALLLEAGRSAKIAMLQTLLRKRIWLQTTTTSRNLHPKAGFIRIFNMSNSQAPAYATQRMQTPKRNSPL